MTLKSTDHSSILIRNRPIHGCYEPFAHVQRVVQPQSPLAKSVRAIALGVGLSAYRLLRQVKRPRLAASERTWLATAILRWGEAKQECGLADYQVHRWDAWHHHRTLIMLGTLFLLKQKKPAGRNGPWCF